MWAIISGFVGYWIGKSMATQEVKGQADAHFIAKLHKKEHKKCVFCDDEKWEKGKL